MDRSASGAPIGGERGTAPGTNDEAEIILNDEARSQGATSVESSSELHKLDRLVNGPKVSLIGASLATDNMGVNALAVGTLRCVLHSFPDASISLFDYGRQPQVDEVQIGERHLRVPLVNIRFSKKPWQPNHILYLLALAFIGRCIPVGRIRTTVLSKNPWIRHLLDADIIAAISGGDSFSDIYGYERLFYVSLPLILVLLLGKDLVLLPQTLGPFRGGLARAVARFILSRAKAVYSRDFVGAGEAKKLLGATDAAQVKFNYDVGFALEPVPPRDRSGATGLFEREAGTPLVGVNVSGLLYISKSDAFGLRFDYREFVRELVRFLIDDWGAIVLLVPHTYGEIPGSESDLLACREVYQQFVSRYGHRLRLVNTVYSESEVKFLIGHCDFFLGSRMHACIAAISQCVPTVPIAYSDKFVGVMETVHVESMVADTRKQDTAEILRLLDSVFRQRASVRQSLMASMPAVKKDVLALFENLGVPFSRESKSDKELVRH